MVAILNVSIAMPSLRISALFCIVMLAIGLSACGKTGPLYLPEQQAGAESVLEEPVRSAYQAWLSDYG